MCLGRRSPTLSGDSTPDRVGLRCRGCGTDYPPSLQYACPNCLGPLDVTYDPATLRARLDRATIEAGPRSIWRYAELLPTKPGPGDLAPGFTPLVPAPRLAEALGIPGELYLKDDTRNPTNSFKDRVVAVAANYDQANRLASQAAEAFGWGFVNVNLRPWYAEGSKTVGLEVAEQLGWSLPDHVVVPIASGALLTKVHQGFRVLAEHGLVADRPFKVHGAQSDGCPPVAVAFAEGRHDVTPVKPTGIVKSLGIGDPADGPEALEVVRSTGGRVEAISDDEVVEAIQLLARTTGVFGETAAGVTVATTARLATAGAFAQGERVVALVTGHGLKTREVLDGRAEATVTVRPNIDALEEALTP